MRIEHSSARFRVATLEKEADGGSLDRGMINQYLSLAWFKGKSTRKLWFLPSNMVMNLGIYPSKKQPIL